MMQTISVIITTYNRRHLVQRAVASVLQQTYQVHEILLIDDGSDDGTGDLIIQKYPEVHYHWQVNQGISAARNRGISLSSGDWIAFLDADDEWLPEKLWWQMSGLNLVSAYQICHTDEIWIRRGLRVNPMKKHRKYGGHIFERCLPLCIISPSAVIIKRKLFGQIGLFDPGLPVCEDYDMWLRICCREPVLYIDKPLIKKYGGHRDQLSRKYWGMDRFRITALEKILNCEQLSPEQQLAVLDTLIKKISIVRNGAQKRGNKELFHQYGEKLRGYKNMLPVQQQTT